MRIGGCLPRKRGDDVGMLDTQRTAVARLARRSRRIARQRGRRGVRFMGGGRDECRIAVEPRTCGVGLDAVGRIGRDQFDPVRVVGEIQREVEARGEIGPRRRDRRRARQHAVVPCVELLRELHAQPFVAALDGWLHRVDDALERHVLVRDRVERRGARRIDERTERQRRRHAHAQRDRIQEQTQQCARFRTLAMRDRHRDDDVRFAGQARQPCVERGQQHREDGRLRVACELPHVGRDRIGQAHRYTCAMQRARGARLAVDRQRERARHVPQRIAPVVELTLALAAGQHVALPVRVVGVLDRQCGQRRFAAFGIRAIRSRQFVERAARAPAVGDRVMRGQQQAVPVVREHDQRRAQQRAACEVERHGRVALGEARGLRIAGGLRLIAQVDRGDRYRQMRVNPLHHDAVVVVDERRAPRFVTADHVIERALQRVAVEHAVDRPVCGDVIRGAGVARLREHPEALLRERCRTIDVRRVRCGSIGRRAARGDRDQRFAGFAFRAIDRVGQLGERRIGEQRVEPQVHAHGGTDRGLQLHRGERIGTQREETIVARRHDVETKQRLPEARDLLFGRRARRIAGGLRRVARGGNPLAQRGTVELAVQRVRQRIATHEPVRLPRGRQLCGHVRLQRGIVGRRAQRDARDQPRRPVGGVGDHGRVGHGRMRAQARGDFRRLHAYAAHLDLIVEAAQIIVCAVVAQACKVAGAIDARAGFTVRIGNEPFGRERRAAVITACDAHTAEQQFAHSIGIGVVDACDPRADHATDRQRRIRVVRGQRRCLARLDRPQHRRDHGFGRPVTVDQAHGRERAAHEFERLLRQRFTAESEHAQRRRHAVARGDGREFAQVGGRKRGDVDRFAHHQRVSVDRRERLRRRHDDAGADRERREPAFVRGVEVDRREMQQTDAGLDRQRGRERVAMRGERPVLDDHRLRRAGRARRIDHVGGRPRMHGHGIVIEPVILRDAGCFGRHVEHVFEWCAERRAAGGVDDAVPQLRVLHDPVEARGRMTRIERHEYAAGLEHGQQRDEQFARTLDAHADPHFGADAGRAQLPGELRRTRIERTARQPQVVLERHRDGGCVGRDARQFADSVMQRSRETRHVHEVLRSGRFGQVSGPLGAASLV
ncbi:hypothetical protein P355_1992 [Burkholderia cenocepacia KC-01]|nr:hypothetical protein P355_1992 [Burkholderia cenocepacia KC-01]